MDLYLLRHGDAGDSLLSPVQDGARKLTSEGVKKTQAVAEAMLEMRYAAPEVFLVSPYVRAQETMAIAREVLAAKAPVVETRALLPGAEMEVTMSQVAKLFNEYKTMMLVGHEPHLSSFASIILGGSTRQIIEMKKSSLALITIVQNDSLRMRGYLRMLLPPRVHHL